MQTIVKLWGDAVKLLGGIFPPRVSAPLSVLQVYRMFRRFKIIWKALALKPLFYAYDVLIHAHGPNTLCVCNNPNTKYIFWFRFKS